MSISNVSLKTFHLGGIRMTLESNQSKQSPWSQSTGSPGSLLGGISPSCLHPVSGHKPLSTCQIQNWMMMIIIISIAASLGFTHFP